MRNSHIQSKTISMSEQAQKGSALMVSLFILLVMTLIGITSLNTSLLEEKMSSNTHLKTASFQDAEAAINAAIREVNKPTDTYLKTAIDTAIANKQKEAEAAEAAEAEEEVEEVEPESGPSIATSDTSDINGTVSLEYIADKPMPGFSMPKFVGLLVEFRSTGKPPAPHDTGSIVTKNTQAALRPAPN